MRAESGALPSRLAGQASLLLAGNAFTMLAGLPFQVYLARQLGAEGLGTWGLLEAVVAVLAGVLGFGVSQTVVRFVPHHLERAEHRALWRLLRLALLIVLTAGVAGYAALAVSGDLLATLWVELRSHQALLPVAALTLPAGMLVFFATQALRGLHEIRHVVIGTAFLQFLVKAGAAIVFLTLGWGLLGYAWAVVLSMAVAALWLGWGLWRRLRVLPTVESWEGMAGDLRAWRGYATVMYGNSLLSVATGHLDRFLVGAFAGPAMVGVLMVARMLQGLPGVFLQVFIVVAGPMLAAASARDDRAARGHLYHLSTDWLVRLSMPLMIFLAVFAGPVLGLFGPDFAERGTAALWLLLAGQAVNLASGQVGNVLNMSGEERTMFRIAVISTLILVVGLPLFTVLQGIEGAALALTLSMAYTNLAAVWAVRSRLGIAWWDERFGRWFLPGAATLATALLLDHWLVAPGPVTLVLTLAGLYGLFHGLHLKGGLNPDDRLLLDTVLSRFAPARGA